MGHADPPRCQHCPRPIDDRNVEGRIRPVPRRQEHVHGGLQEGRPHQRWVRGWAHARHPREARGPFPVRRSGQKNPAKEGDELRVPPQKTSPTAPPELPGPADVAERHAAAEFPAAAGRPGPGPGPAADGGRGRRVREARGDAPHRRAPKDGEEPQRKRR